MLVITFRKYITSRGTRTISNGPETQWKHECVHPINGLTRDSLEMLTHLKMWGINFKVSYGKPAGVNIGQLAEHQHQHQHWISHLFDPVTKSSAPASTKKPFFTFPWNVWIDILCHKTLQKSAVNLTPIRHLFKLYFPNCIISNCLNQNSIFRTVPDFNASSKLCAERCS